MENNFAIGQKVNYHGYICDIDTINENGTMNLHYEPIPFLPVYVMEVKPTEVKPA